MKPPRFAGEHPSRLHALDARIRRDLDALASMTASGLPKIENTARAFQTAPDRETREGWWMKTLRITHGRPWLVTAMGVGIVALVLLVVPISYDRLSGYDVVITVQNLNSLGDPDRIDRVAEEMGRAFAARNVSVSKDAGSNSAQVLALLPVQPKATVERKAQAFARALREQGWTVASQVRPREERVLGSMLAYAADQVAEIRIQTAGKSEAEIEEEIRAQLLNAGFTNPSVDVTKDGEQTRIQIIERREGEGQGSVPECPQTQLVIDGHVQQSQARVQLSLEGGPRTDEELRDEVLRQLREQGIEAEVVVENGCVVSIVPRH